MGCDAGLRGGQFEADDAADNQEQDYEDDFEPAAMGFKKSIDQPKVDGVSAGLRSA